MIKVLTSKGMQFTYLMAALAQILLASFEPEIAAKFVYMFAAAVSTSVLVATRIASMVMDHQTAQVIRIGEDVLRSLHDSPHCYASNEAVKRFKRITNNAQAVGDL